MTYYVLTLAAGSLSKDLYLGTALSGLVEIPAYALCLITLKYFGRVANVAGYMIIGGLSLSVIIISDPILPILSTSLALLGKVCISASFAIIYMHSNEIFPTTLRPSGMGICGMSARLGGLAASHVVEMGRLHKNLHYFVLGILCLISGTLAAKLPETKDLSLPESIQDLLSRRVHVVSVQSPNVSYKKILIAALRSFSVFEFSIS